MLFIIILCGLARVGYGRQKEVLFSMCIEIQWIVGENDKKQRTRDNILK